MKRLIASDYDGTVNRGGDSIQTDAKAIKRWREAGNYFGIVTGRGVGIAKELKDNGVETDFILCNNGSVCSIDGEYVFIKRNNINLVPGLIKFISERGAGYFGLIAPEGERGFTADTVPDDLLEKAPDFAQLTAICGSNEDASRISDAINEEYKNVLVSYPNGQFIDIVKYGTSKATGIRDAAKLLGVDEKNCCAVGDNLNDIVMIEAFYGFAVKSGREQAKAAADVVVDSVSDMIDGLLCGKY